MLKDIIEKAFDGTSVFRLFEEDGKLLVSLFDSELLKTEISYEMLNSAYKDNTYDYHTLLNSILLSILKQRYNIIPCENNAPEKEIIPQNRDGFIQFGQKLNEISSNANPSIIVVDGDEQSGTTILVQQYCEILNDDNCDIHWLDFNGGANDFRKTIEEIISNCYPGSPFYEEKMICIVLDELRCCGYDEAESIFRFFSDFVTILNGKKIYTQLILIQNKNDRVYKGDEGVISLTKRESLMELKGVQEKDANLFHLKGDDEAFVGQFIDEKAKDWDEKSKRLFFKILVISLYGIDVLLDADEWRTAKKLVNNVTGLKLLSYPDRAKLLNSETCVQLFNIIEKKYWVLLGFEKTFSECVTCSEAAKRIFEEYYKKNKLSILDISKILQRNAYYYNKNWGKNSALLDFMELLKRANDFESKIIKKVESSSESYFGNHLGAILFAAEALSFFSSDWNALAAWDKLSLWVREMYFVDGQKLPEIRYGKEQLEKTWDDFFNGKHLNSIKNQIFLQDVVISRYGMEFDLSNSQDMEERDYQYVLSPKQETNKEQIDIDRFFQTYILALLFEFELTAPQSRYDKKRVNILFDMIKKNILEENDNDIDIAYFYPSRVPWVSARLLLAITMYDPKRRGSHLDIHTIQRIRKLLINYLISYSYSYQAKDGETYRIWLPGTGRWNGILETTMMCTFALKKANADAGVVSEGEKYIQSQKGRWLTPSSLADGLWAIETFKLNNTVGTDNVLLLAHDIWNDIMPFFKNGVENESNRELYQQQDVKNDKSLGDSHIAKTFISLVNQLVVRKPPVFVDFDEMKNLSIKCKVFISFHTESSKELAQKLVDRLKKEDDAFDTFCYLSEMRAGHWRVQLTNAIHMSNAFILIVDQRTMSSPNVLDEIKCRINDEKPILPLICVSDDELKNIINGIDDIELLNKFQKESLKKALSKEINNLVYENDANYFDKIVQYLKQSKSLYS